MGVNHASIIVARTVSADLSGVDLNKYDVLAFYSPNEISALVSQFGQKEDMPMIAVFGDKTAVAAANAGLKVYAKAPAPGTPSMAKAIELLVEAAKSGKELAPIEVGESHVAEDFIKAQEAKKRTGGVITIGNVYNDIQMSVVADLSICVIGREGCCGALLMHCDVVVTSIDDALDLLLKTGRLRATLRT